MGALPRPDIPPGPHRELVSALHELHHRAGWPSLRRLASEAGCSHTTVSKVLSGPQLPPWGVLELIVEAMDGDVARFRQLWLDCGRPAAPGGRAALPIAGRRAELDAVRRHFSSGTGVLLLTGEAGIGKTALVSAAVVGTGEQVASAACRPLSTEVPLLPLTDLLRELRREHRAWFDQALVQCPAYVASSLRQLLPEIEADATEPVSEEWARQRLFTAIAALLSGLREIRPLALLVEDAHWADATTLDVLEVLGSHRFPMVVTVRTDDPEVADGVVDWLARARRLPRAASLALGPLTRDETAQQLELLSGTRPTAQQVEQVHARSLGLPLFTEQLALHPNDWPMPDLLTELLRRRLRDLPARAWSVARALGVADRPLTTGQLAHVAGLDPVDGLRELDRLRLLAAADGPLVRLRHPLVADAIRAQLAPGEASEVHGRAATLLADLPDPPAAEIAEHWFWAGNDAEELRWRIRAAEAASAGYAVRAASTQWRRVLALWPNDIEELSDPPLTRAGMFVEVLDAVERDDFPALPSLMKEALVVAKAARPDQAAAILLRAGTLEGWLGEGEAGLELTARAADMFAELPLSREHVLALRALRASLHRAGRYEEAADVGERALAGARRLGIASEVKQALAQQAWSQSVSGDTAGAQRTIRELVGIELDPPDPYCEIEVAVSLTDMLLMTGAPAEELLEVAQPAFAAADTWDLHQWVEAVLRWNVAEALHVQGHPERAWEQIAPHTEGDATDADRAPLFEQRAVLELMFGNADEARATIAAIEAGNLRRGGSPSQLEFTAVAVKVALWSGHEAAALDRALPVLETQQDTDKPVLLAPLLVLAARAAADVGDGPGGARLRALHRGLTADPFAPHPTFAAAAAHGAAWAAEVARMEGRETIECWTSAAAAWDDLIHPYDAAYCRWRGAQVGLATGQGTTARRLLRRAAADARGHVPLSDAIRRTAEG